MSSKETFAPATLSLPRYRFGRFITCKKSCLRRFPVASRKYAMMSFAIKCSYIFGRCSFIWNGIFRSTIASTTALASVWTLNRIAISSSFMPFSLHFCISSRTYSASSTGSFTSWIWRQEPPSRFASSFLLYLSTLFSISFKEFCTIFAVER